MVARQRKRLSRPELADLIGVTARTIGGWEAGTTVVPLDRIATISRILGFPPEFFSMKQPAGVGVGAVSFRSLSRKSADQRDAALAMCDLAVDLAAWIEPRIGRDAVNVPDLSQEKPDFAAEILRKEWGLGHAPISNMIHMLEAKGVRIFALPENCREIDACSFWFDDLPYILVDSTRSAERIRFNLAHELGHLALHRHGAPIGQEAEKEANAFASCLLMDLVSIQRNLPRSVNLENLIVLKRRWGVSAAALAYRLNKVGYLTDWHYKSIVIEMRRRDYHVTEPNPMPHEQSLVLDFTLWALLAAGISLRRVADETNLPHEEVVGLMQGLAMIAMADHDVASPTEKRAAFKVV